MNEALLKAYHARYPGITTRAFQHWRDDTGRNSYERLIQACPEDAAVLDLGCGDGFLLSLLDNGTRRLAGLDTSPEELAYAAKRLAHGDLKQGDAARIPFPTQTFDRVYCHLAFMLFKDPATVLQEMARILKPGGRVGLVLPAGEILSETMGDFVTHFWRLWRELDTPWPEFDHPLSTDTQRFKALIQTTGFVEPQEESFVINRDAPIDTLFTELASVYHLALLSAEQRARLYVATTTKWRALADDAGARHCRRRLRLWWLTKP